MSERKAKLKRKNEVEAAPKKKVDVANLIVNIIIVILILALLGVGGWAAYNKLKPVPQQNGTDQMDATQEQAAAPQTIGDYLSENGLTLDEFLTTYELTEVEGITEESIIDDVIRNMTLANFAKFNGTDVQSLGLGEQYTEDTLMGVIIDEINAAQQTATDDASEPEAE